MGNHSRCFKCGEPDEFCVCLAVTASTAAAPTCKPAQAAPEAPASEQQEATTASASGRVPAQEFLNWNRRQEKPLVVIGKEMGVFRKAMEFSADGQQGASRAVLDDAQLDQIARSYFAEEWAQKHAKDAIHDAFAALARAPLPAQADGQGDAA